MLQRISSLLIVAALLPACESSAGDKYPDCDVSRHSQVSFVAPGSEDQLAVIIKGSPCYEATLTISIATATGVRLYEYEGRFKSHVAVHWEDSSLDGDAERLADWFADPESFGLTRDLPQWLPEAEYYEANNQVIQISKEDYEELRHKDWTTYTHSVHYEGWRVVAFDAENHRSIIVSEGTL